MVYQNQLANVWVVCESHRTQLILRTSFFLSLIIHVALCQLVFEAKFISVLKATIAYLVLFVVLFLVVSLAVIPFAFHEIVLGAPK